MLIRFVIQNIYSFGDRKEFTTIPNTRLKTLKKHIYKPNGFDLLKMASVYGANGAGKSNLIKSLQLFQNLVLEEKIPFYLKNIQFKFNSDSDNKNQIFGIEFIKDNTAFYYGIEVLNNLISTEELYLSGLGKKPDKLIFERKTDENKVTKITFLEEFEKDEKSQLLKELLLEEFVKPDKLILRLLANRENKFLKDTKTAFNWFKDSLQIITPDSKPVRLINKVEKDDDFKKYADDFMQSFNIGITSLISEKKEIDDFFDNDYSDLKKNITNELEKNPDKTLHLRSNKGEIVIVKEDDQIWVKTLKIGHVGKNKKTALFELDEESDGTIRLLDFVPAFQDLINKDKVFFIDEIERSVHPLLIKELTKKFSLDSDTKGQLIFTTHESNLLDQEIFRQDEIWFAEKDKNGSTDLYSLSDFKEHKTIDIRKGYLNGRYGSIPFLSNLKDLNWHKYDTD